MCFQKDRRRVPQLRKTQRHRLQRRHSVLASPNGLLLTCGLNALMLQCEWNKEAQLHRKTRDQESLGKECALLWRLVSSWIAASLATRICTSLRRYASPQTCAFFSTLNKPFMLLSASSFTCFHSSVQRMTRVDSCFLFYQAAAAVRIAIALLPTS